jgi:hypothetical protein
MRTHTIATQARVGARPRMNRIVVVVSAVLLGAAAIAADASATFRSFDDRRGDTKCLHRDTLSRQPCSDSRRRNADVVRATAGHEGGPTSQILGPRLTHTIRVVGKFQQVELIFNTDSDSKSEWRLFVGRGGGDFEVSECRPGLARTGPVRADFHLHSVEIFFSKRCIGNPRHYGWRARVGAGPPRTQATDFVPNRGVYIRE